MLRPTIESCLLAIDDLKAKFGGNYYIGAERSESFAYQLFVSEGTIHFRGVEERDAALNGRANKRDPLLLVDCRPQAKAQSHAAKSKRGDFQITSSKFAFLHEGLLWQSGLLVYLVSG